MNLLWIFFSLAGALILGVFPATTAMFAIIRQWLKGNTDLPVFKTFWEFYKRDFWKSNLLGLYLIIITLLLYVDFLFVQYNQDNLFSWTAIPFYVLGVIFTLLLLYVFPAFVHFDLKVHQIIKNAFLLMLVNPVITLMIAICLASILIIMYLVPALLFIYGASAYAFITMWLCYTAFVRAQSKKQSKVS